MMQENMTRVSQILRQKQKMDQNVYFVNNDDFFMQITYCADVCIIIKILNIDLISKGTMFYLSIFPDTMSEALKSSFQNLQQMFDFLKKERNLDIDMHKGIIKLKIFKVVGDKNIDASIRIVLQDKQLTNDKFIIYSYKVWLKKLQQKMDGMQNKLINSQKKYDQSIKQLKKQQMVPKNNKKAQCDNKPIIMFIVFVMIIILGNYLMNDDTEYFNNTQNSIDYQQQLDNNTWRFKNQTYMNDVNLLMQKLKQQTKKQIQNMLILERQNILNSLNQHNTKLEKQLQANKIDIHKQMNHLIEQLNLKVQKINKFEISIKNNQNSMTKIIDNKIEQLNKIQELLKNKLQKLSKLKAEDHDDNRKQLKKIISIQKQLQDLGKLINKFTVYDLQSQFLQSFQIDRHSAKNLAVTGRLTQILLKQQIPYHNKHIYSFLVKHQIRSSGTISIGVVDAIRINQRTSLFHNNTVAYSCRGGVWKNGIKLQNSAILSKLEQLNSQESYIVQMQVQLSTGIVKWYANGLIIAQTKSQRLQDNTIKFKPYIEMSTKGDFVKFIKNQ